jgi:hypothetical protein
VLASAPDDGLGPETVARPGRWRLIQDGRARARALARDTGEPRWARWWDQAVVHLVHAQGRSRRIGSRALARPSAIGVAHSPCRRLSGSSPSARIGKRSWRTHAGGTRLIGDPQRSRARLHRGAWTRDASVPCSRQIRSPFCLPLRCLAGRLLAPPVGLVLNPSARRPRLPVVARLRRRGLGLTTVPPAQRHGEAGTLSGRGGEKTRIPWGQRDGEAMARRWRGDGEGGTRWIGRDRVGTGVARHELRRGDLKPHCP